MQKNNQQVHITKKSAITKSPPINRFFFNNALNPKASPVTKTARVWSLSVDMRVTEKKGTVSASQTRWDSYLFCFESCCNSVSLFLSFAVYIDLFPSWSFNFLHLYPGCIFGISDKSVSRTTVYSMFFRFFFHLALNECNCT